MRDTQSSYCLSIVKMSLLCKLIYSQCHLIKIPTYFSKNNKKSLKIQMKMQRTQKVKNNLDRDTVVGLPLSNFKIITVIKNLW